MSGETNGKAGQGTALFSEFPPTSYEEWRKAAEKILKGAPFEKRLVTKTYEGISLQPMYRQEDVADLPHTNSLPGFPPYVRFVEAAGYVDKVWEVAQELPYGTPEEFNEIARFCLQNGQTALNLVLDHATLTGVDADKAAPGEVGVHGTSISTVKDLATALAEIGLHDEVVEIELELAVDAEAADLAQVVAAGVLEAVVEELLDLLLVGRVAGAQALVDADQRLLVALRLVVAQGVEEHVVALDGVGDDLELADAEALEGLEGGLGELLAGLGQHLLLVVGIGDVVDEDLTDHLLLRLLAGELELAPQQGEVGLVAGQAVQAFHDHRADAPRHRLWRIRAAQVVSAIGASYLVEWSPRFSTTLRADAAFRSKTWFDPFNLTRDEVLQFVGDTPTFVDVPAGTEGYVVQFEELAQDAYWLVNARITLLDSETGFEAALFGTNLFDEEYVNTILPITAFGFDEGVYGRPREWGVSLRYSF